MDSSREMEPPVRPHRGRPWMPNLFDHVQKHPSKSGRRQLDERTEAIITEFGLTGRKPPKPPK